MAEAASKQFHLDAPAEVFRIIAGLDWPCGLMVGQPAGFGSRRLQPPEPWPRARARLTPLVGKDVDLQGDLATAQRIARAARHLPARRP